MKKQLLIFVLCLSVAGCGIAAKVQAREDVQKSKAAYKECLADHPKSVNACSAQKEAYDADMDEYIQFTNGTRLNTSSDTNN